MTVNEADAVGDDELIVKIACSRFVKLSGQRVGIAFCSVRNRNRDRIHLEGLQNQL